MQEDKFCTCILSTLVIHQSNVPLSTDCEDITISILSFRLPVLNKYYHYQYYTLYHWYDASTRLFKHMVAKELSSEINEVRMTSFTVEHCHCVPANDFVIINYILGKDFAFIKINFSICVRYCWYYAYIVGI